MAKKKKESTITNLDSVIANENISECNLKEEIELSMLSYSVMTIIDRALPDVRDGLKPVQRRILYCCKDRGYENNKPFIKCAKIQGEVSGNYHPHGSCYGTIANMSQPWTYRYPLIDFHGNNGSLDGDEEAADRYTEARLAKIASESLEDVTDKHCVEFQQNYSETLMEPKILPSLLPNFLINGSDGIAVGYTTNSPSHNLSEVCDGIIHAIKNLSYTTKDLMKYIKGPDFPYGSLMLSEGLNELYETGQAKIEFRANYDIETNKENDNPQIVFIDLPPKSEKPKLLEKINEMIVTKQLPRCVSVRDESKGIDIRIVIECQKTANIPLLLKDLFAKTNLQKKCSFIMRGVVDKTLKLISLTDYMEVYITHRREVVKNRADYLLHVAEHKLNMQQGLTKVIDDIKTAVNIIIDSEDTTMAKKSLMEKYKLNDEQAEFILEKKVRTLVRLDRDSIFDLIKELENNIAFYHGVLENNSEIDKIMIKQLQELKKKFGDERRTKIVDSFESIGTTVEEVKEEVVCVLGHNGSFTIYEEDEFEKFETNRTFKDRNNLFRQYMHCKRSDELIVIQSDGICERVGVAELQYNTIKMDKAMNFILFNTESNQTLISVLKNGGVKKTLINKMKFKKNKPTPLIKDFDSEIIVNKVVDDIKDEVITLASYKGFVGRFSCNSFVATACGARAMSTCKIDADDYMIDCKISKESEDGENKLLLIYTFEDDSLGYKVMPLSDLLVKGRSSRALSCADGRKFGHLLKIFIAKDKFTLLDDKNKEFVIEKYNVSKRSDKCNEKRDKFGYNVNTDNLVL